MAETKGLVQRLKVGSGVTYLYVGPSPTNTAAFFIQRLASDTAEETSAKDDIVAAVASAMVARREIVAIYSTNSSEMTGLRIDPV